MAKGIHLFPYRTQKLSLSAPMVLGWRRPGRVGRCRIPQRKASDDVWGFFFVHPVSSFFRSFSSQRPTLYLVRFPHVRRLWRIQHMGEHLGEWDVAGFSMGAMPGRVGRCRIPIPEIQRTFGGRTPTIHKKSRPFYTADGFLHIRVILKRDTEHARREAGISRPSCAGSRAARSGRRRRPPEASTARAAFCRRSGAERTQTARRNQRSRCRPLHP